MILSEIGLTPSQYNEAEGLDPDFVAAWLDALDTAKGVRQPAAWFMAAIRTGRLPGEVPTSDRAKEIRLAEAWIRVAGLYEPTEEALEAALFGNGGRLEEWADDYELRGRMVDLFQVERPRGERADRERLERAERNRAAMELARQPLTDAVGSEA